MIADVDEIHRLDGVFDAFLATIGASVVIAAVVVWIVKAHGSKPNS